MQKLFARIVVIFIVLFSATTAKSEQINVYLKCDNSSLRQQVENFNIYLKRIGIFKRYRIQPFISGHPLHVTLYLAEFKKKNLKQITTRVARLARHWKPFELTTEKLHLSQGGYLLLDVENPHQYQPEKLHELSNAVVRVLAPLRNKRALIPTWASQDPEKQKSFKQTGSPNTGAQFNPHISILSKSFDNKNQQKQFQQRLVQLIASYKKSHPQQTHFQATTIGIGYADEKGQITEEIASFPLNGVIL